MNGFVPGPKIPVHTLSRFFRENFGGKVRKVALDAGFSCPNRTGAERKGGCLWCDPHGSGPGPADADWESALRREAAKLLDKGYAGAISYFQAFTGTFGEIPRLEETYEKSLSVPGVLGIAIGTRPDCLSGEVLDLLGRLNGRTFLWVEVGMQTMHDPTLALCGRGHRHSETRAAFGRLRDLGIRTVLHLIAGLPGETEDMMMESFAEAAGMKPWGLKLHPLHVVRGSALEGWFNGGRLNLLELREYARLAASLIEMTGRETVFHRITGERPEGVLLAPAWCLDKDRVRREIHEALRVRGGFQGRLAEVLD